MDSSVQIDPSLGENDAIISVEGNPISTGKWRAFRVLGEVKEVGSQEFAKELKVSQRIRGYFLYPNTVQVVKGQLVRMRWVESAPGFPNPHLHIVASDGSLA